ncbi:MAG: DUF916 domain-containing protein [Patescibacteria group bacterium]|nr:DUF916 domain-containing protein [Patescibacteria group bacterium]
MFRKIFSISVLIALSIAIITISQSTQAAGLTISPPKFEEAINPGETVQKLIKVTNSGKETIELNVSVQDFVAKGEGGQQSYVEASGDLASQKSSLASWIKYNQEPVTVLPGETVKVPFEISVPNDAEPGGHYGTIFFSPPANKGAQVSIVQRVGSLILVRISGDIKENTKLDTFDTYSVEYNDKGEIADIDTAKLKDYSPSSFFETLPVKFVTRVENTGNVHTKARGKIELFNTFGVKLSEIGVEPVLNNQGLETDKKIVDYIPFNPEGGNVLPNSFRGFQQTWQGYPKLVFDETTGKKIVKYSGFAIGKYKAVLTLQYGSQNTSLPVQEVMFWVMPWRLILGLVILVVALTAGGKVLHKRKKSSRKAIEDEIRRKVLAEMKRG